MGLRTLTARTIAVLSVLALFLGAMFSLLLKSVSDEEQATRTSLAASARVSAAMSEQKLLLDLETGLRGYLITGNRRFLEPYETARAALPAQQRRLLALAADVNDRAALAALAQQASNYIAGFAQPLTDAPPPASRVERARITGEGKRLMDAIRREHATYIAGELAEARTAISASSANARATRLLAAGGLVASVLFVLLVAIYQLRSILAPIGRVAMAARRVATGDLSVRVEERGSGEVSDLAQSFNLMATSLEYTRDELERQNAELEAQQVELEMAVESLAHEKARVERYQSFGVRLAAEAEIEPLSDTILQELGDVAHAEVGALYVFVEEAGEAALMAVRALDPGSLPVRIRPGEGLAGRALAEQRAVSASYDEGGLRLPTAGGEVAVPHELHVALVQGTRPVGVVTLGRVGGVAFGPADIDAIEQLVERAAIGVSAALALRTTRNQAVVNRAVVDSAADAFIGTDDQGVIVQWNRAAETMFGIAADAAIGRSVTDIVVPERHREAARERIAGFAAVASDWPEMGSREFTAVRADGTEFVVEANIGPLHLGDRVQFSSFVRDVSGRKRLEHYREAHHRVTRGLAESASMDDARVHVLDGLSRSLDADFGCTAIPQGDDGSLVVTRVWSRERDDRSQLEAAFDGALLAPGDELAGQVRETGEPAYIDFAAGGRAGSVMRLATAAGLQSGVVFPVFHGREFMGAGLILWRRRRPQDPDLLVMLASLGVQIGAFIARKRAESEADRLKDEFFALVSHELRTPLTSIIGYLELALEEDALDEETRRFLDVVHRNAGRLLRLVGDLLFVAQVEAGQLSFDPGLVDLWDVCAESVETARPRAEAAGIELRFEGDHVHGFAGDAGRLGQALDNLVGNALKFTPDGGQVSVAVRATTGEAVIEVSDTGIGIAEHEHEHLFDRFFRSKSSHEQAVQGVGLGLTIVKAIVEGHGGRISVRSVEGRGTTFEVVLPRHDGDGASRSSAPRFMEVPK